MAKYIYTKLIIKYKETIVSCINTIKLSHSKCTNYITKLSRRRVLFQSDTSSLLAIIFNTWHDTHFHIYTPAFSLYKTNHQTNHSIRYNPCTLQHIFHYLYLWVRLVPNRIYSLCCYHLSTSNFRLCLWLNQCSIQFLFLEICL